MNRGCAQYTQIIGVPLRASAVAVASGDYPTYTFTLPQGVQSHDGNELTAEDVKWNWERAKDPKTGSSAAPDWAGSSFQVLDSHTLKVSFERPYPAFIGATVA